MTSHNEYIHTQYLHACAKRLEFRVGLWMYEEWMDRSLAVLRPFKSISAISGRRADDNKRLCAMETCLRLKRSCFMRGSNPEPLDQYASV